ncbi:MAG: exonuclease SbcCD subunit D [Marinagarivorans sp.]|nr:exonuclease SbcCD subunit D [Marinagarivorans sp.]
MKFLHTSDWHLGRLFHNVSLLDDQTHILQQIITYATKYAVDAVLIAGDIFDRAVPPSSAVALLDETLHTLTQTLNIPVILISGNHDSAERLSFGARLLANQNLHILHALKHCDDAVVIHNKNQQSAAIYGIPYHTPEHIRADFDEPVKTFDQAHSFLVNRIDSQKKYDYAILMSHCFVTGADECESERPLAIGGADRVSFTPMLPFDYVALGHLHGQQKRGAEHIRYSGSPLKYSFSEVPHKKSVTLVELQKNTAPIISQLPLIPQHEVRCLVGELQQLLDAGLNDKNADDYIAVTLTDKHAILDAMGKLRAVYPNVLQLEKTFLQNHNASSQKRANLQHGELAMFDDFFTEITGEPLSASQKTAMEKLLNDLAKTAAEDNT